MDFGYAGEADLGKGYYNTKRKLGVTMPFLEAIKQQLLFQEAVKYKAMYSIFFLPIEALLSLKNAWLPPVFILDTKSTC